MKLCKGCGEEIHPKRLEILPYTTTCVKCSTEAPKAGRIVTFGTGEEIHTEVEILDRETFRKIQRMENSYLPGIGDVETLSEQDEIDSTDYSSDNEEES